jgi:hypothetical protein
MLTIMGPSLNSQSEFAIRLSKRFHVQLVRICFRISGLYLVWSFAGGKTPEGIAAKRQFLSPGKPGFCGAKMRPNNEVLKKPNPESKLITADSGGMLSSPCDRFVLYFAESCT